MLACRAGVTSIVRRMVLTPQFTADSSWLDELLARLPAAKVAVFGDLCLDAYWEIDALARVDSLETGLPVRFVQAQRYTPGGAANVAANLAALGVGAVELVGLVGADLFGQELLRQLVARGIPISGILPGPADWQTPVYVKPMLERKELNRFDFGTANPPALEAWKNALGRFEAALARCRVAVINQQIVGGWDGERLAALRAVMVRHPETLFMVDSRDHAAEFPHAFLKLNLAEAARLLPESASENGEAGLAEARALVKRQGRPVAVTRGEHGLVLATRDEVCSVPGVDLPGAVDPVGAGDAALAALAAAFAVGAGALEAATFANLAAAITTRQIGVTGVATPELLRAAGPAPDYVHQPRLAARLDLAHYAAGSRLEMVTARKPARLIRHAIFDHDGTVSTLRQGWEAIMEPMMLAAILGPKAADCDEATHARVVATVRTFIDRTTGIQTLAQMKGLADLVRDFGFVAPAAVLDEHGYKAIYNEALLTLVRERRQQLERGELAPADWQIKNAVPLLERLRDAGVTLYLASGTDEADVIDEAKALGYAELFNGGIYGAVGDLRVEAKRVVLDRLIRTGGIEGGDLVVLGDGPVEIREGRRRGAFTVGVASDEVRRHGLDAKKRSRLIRAGADVVVPDFSQLDRLWAVLGLAR